MISSGCCMCGFRSKREVRKLLNQVFHDVNLQAL